MAAWTDALDHLSRERAAAWRAHASRVEPQSEHVLEEAVIEDPSRHEWRLVDAALERLRCTECDAELGAGPRGCAPCDIADGFRFAAREVDRAGMPRGNEHAIRVSSAILRAPHRYPPYIVRGNELFLPLFTAGQMPTRDQQLRLDHFLKDTPNGDDLEGADSFEELLRRVDAAARARAPAR